MGDGYYVLQFEDGVFLYKRENTQWSWWSTLYKSWFECLDWSDNDAVGLILVG